MARYIDADHFDTRVRMAGGMVEYDLTEDFKDGVLTTLEMLKNEPAADVRENVRGEWIEADLDKNFIICSACKNAGYKDRMAWRPEYAAKYFNFCPNCGADMRGDKK